MKRLTIFFTMILSFICGFSQDFCVTNNMEIQEITETEYRNAYKSRVKNKYKWIREGKEYKRIINRFLDSDTTREFYTYDLIKNANSLDIRCLKLKSKCMEESYILQETAPVGSKAYYLKGTITDPTTMFGVGNINNDKIYYASPDFDCDQHVWCRWYTFVGGKVNVLAELEEMSFEYDFANYYDLPFFFADNKGFYYIIIHKNPNIFNDVGIKLCYKIRIK